MNILFKRHYKFIVVLILCVLISIIFAQTRMISYNFWKYQTELETITYNYTNSTNILNDEIFHEISINITDKQYEYILESYKNNNEKEYVEVDITIDWKLIENVWLRLKWNIDLLEILTNLDTDTFLKPALLIKFDKYIEGQTYQWLSEIAFRTDSSDSLLWQLVSFKIFRDLWLLAPRAWYTSLTFWDKWTYLYMISEVIDDEYVEENFLSEWVLYKALNSLSFSYLWDDPTLYIDLFEQETMENNYDMKLLINILEFVSESSDEEFEENLENYIDIDSYIWMIVLDELLWREDKLLWLLNNYYIYINTETNIASFIVRDQKMSFWNTNTPLYDILLKYYSKNDLEDLDDISSLLTFTQKWIKVENLELDSNKTYFNDLKERLLRNETFRAIYEEKLNEYKQLIYDDSLAINSLNYYKNIFLNYSNFNYFMDYWNYQLIIDTISEYIDNMSDYNLKTKFMMFFKNIFINL